jgi:hypothetical protein
MREFSATCIRMKIENYHEGDRSEQLAQAILSTIAHIIPVPRQADHFGVDLFAHLFSQSRGGLRSTGRTVAIQLKSNLDSISVAAPDAIQALHALAVPFLIGVVNRTHRNIALYSTLFRFAAYWDNPDAPLIFDLKADVPGLTFHENATRIHCGRPIALAIQDELDDPDRGCRDLTRQVLRNNLEYWIRLEADAIAWKTTGLPMSPCPPPEYSTNEYPGSVASIILATDMARLTPLFDAMQFSAIAFHRLSEAAATEEGLNSDHARVIFEMTEYAVEHMRRVNEFRELLADRLGPGSPYIWD